MTLRRRDWGVAALLAAPMWLLPVSLSEGGTAAGPMPVDVALLAPGERTSARLRSFDRRVEQALADRETGRGGSDRIGRAPSE